MTEGTPASKSLVIPEDEGSMAAEGSSDTKSKETVKHRRGGNVEALQLFVTRNTKSTQVGILAFLSIVVMNEIVSRGDDVSVRGRKHLRLKCRLKLLLKQVSDLRYALY
jgi:hypothetical protein